MKNNRRNLKEAILFQKIRHVHSKSYLWNIGTQALWMIYIISMNGRKSPFNGSFSGLLSRAGAEEF
ncbi:MAG: hypothetical protein ABRQ39_31410 [Candidatus Eremiobacterota bacterium]